MNQNQPKKFKTIGWIFAIFFTTFIVVDIAYIFVAEKTWRGLAIEDGYQKGLKYNDTIAAVKAQEELGWKLQINYQPSSTKSGNLLVKLLDKNNQEIAGANLIANIKRPVQEGQDFTINLQFNAATSSYNSSIQFPIVGQWDVEITAKKNSDVYQDMKRLVIR